MPRSYHPNTSGLSVIFFSPALTSSQEFSLRNDHIWTCPVGYVWTSNSGGKMGGEGTSDLGLTQVPDSVTTSSEFEPGSSCPCLASPGRPLRHWYLLCHFLLCTGYRGRGERGREDSCQWRIQKLSFPFCAIFLRTFCLDHSVEIIFTY